MVISSLLADHAVRMRAWCLCGSRQGVDFGDFYADATPAPRA